MSERERRLWRAVRRGLLLVCAVIEQEQAQWPWGAARRSLLLFTEAIEKETNGGTT